jgi:hypothetical protein
MFEMETPRGRWSPAWRPVGLIEALEGLRLRFKDAVARLLGGGAARAVRGIAAALLGLPPEEDALRDDPWAGHSGHGHGGWDEDDEMGGEAALAWAAPEAGGLRHWLSGWASWLLAALEPLARWLFPSA